VVDYAHLEQALDAAQSFQDELVAGVELDAGLPVDALGSEFCAELALGLGPVAS
jgi:hypothetical protein